MQVSETLKIRGFAAKHRESSEVSRILSKFYAGRSFCYFLLPKTKFIEQR
jgi:hypothetical protein